MGPQTYVAAKYRRKESIKNAHFNGAHYKSVFANINIQGVPEKKETQVFGYITQ